MVGLFQLRRLHQGVGMGMLRQQHDAEGVPVQSGHRMKGALLARPVIVSHHIIGQSSVKPAPGRVNQHSRRLFHRDQMVILVKDGQGALLRGIFRFRLIQNDGELISGFHRVVRMLRLSVDQDQILPLQPVHKPGGHFQFLFQESRQPAIMGCNMS